MMWVKCVEPVPYGSKKTKKCFCETRKTGKNAAHSDIRWSRRVPHKIRTPSNKISKRKQNECRSNWRSEMCINMDLSENVVPQNPWVCRHFSFWMAIEVFPIFRHPQYAWLVTVMVLIYPITSSWYSHRDGQHQPNRQKHLRESFKYLPRMK